MTSALAIIHRSLRKQPSYFSLCLVFLLSTTLFLSCHTASKTTAGDELSDTDRRRLENLYIDGCKERLAGRVESAQKYFRECERMDPKNIPVKYELSNLLRITDKIDEATKLAKECVDSDPKNQWYHLAYIECLHVKKNYQMAAEHYEKMVKYFPEKSEYFESMAIEYAMARNFAKSFKIYEELERRYGINETFTLNKIKLLKEQKKYGESEAEIKKLIATNPQEPRYLTYLAEFYEDVNQFNKAKEVYDKILVIDPTNPTVHLALANYYKDQNKPEESHNELKIAYANPDLDVDTKLKILISYFSISEQYPEYTPKGYELCDIMLKVHPMSPEAHSIYAEFLLRDKKIMEARDHYLIAAYNDKSRYVVWGQLLYVESLLNQNDSLEKHSALAIELFPTQPKCYLYNGVSNLALRNYTKAAQSLNDGLEFVYDDKGMMLDFYNALGESYNNLKEYEKSDKAFDDALKVDPDNVNVLNNYSYYLSLRKEKLEKAEKLSRRSNEIAHDNPRYNDTYGWILYQQGKYKEAEEWLERAAKKANKNAVILEHYGDLLFKLGRPEEALKYWNLAKEAGGNSETLLKKISTKKLND